MLRSSPKYSMAGSYAQQWLLFFGDISPVKDLLGEKPTPFQKTAGVACFAHSASASFLKLSFRCLIFTKKVSDNK